MEQELKNLLQKVLAKLDGMDARLKVVEAKAHDQVTISELERRANQYRIPSTPAFPWPPAITSPIDLSKVQIIC